jgi:hypothetical protein
MAGLGRTRRLVLPLMLGRQKTWRQEIEDEEGSARIMGFDAHRATLQGCACRVGYGVRQAAKPGRQDAGTPGQRISP